MAQPSGKRLKVSAKKGEGSDPQVSSPQRGAGLGVYGGAGGYGGGPGGYRIGGHCGFHGGHGGGYGGHGGGGGYGVPWVQ